MPKALALTAHIVVGMKVKVWHKAEWVTGTVKKVNRFSIHVDEYPTLFDMEHVRYTKLVNGYESIQVKGCEVTPQGQRGPSSGEAQAGSEGSQPQIPDVGLGPHSAAEGSV